MTKKKVITDEPKKRAVTDAPESNAGDDFHVLWAVRKSIELINFNEDGLKALTLEGTVVNDATEIDPDGDRMLGVDLGEYFGGEDFESATKIVFSQLKYSTRHSTTPWSIASISQGKKSKYAGSIIHRLAEIYSGYDTKFDRKVISGKLTLKLVSNRPFSDSSAEIIKKAQAELTKHLDGLSFAKLKAALDASMHEDLDRLLAASTLSATKFTDFLRLLDFDECGAASRPLLKEDVIHAIAEVNGVESSRNYDSLHVKIWNKMMPESRKNNKVTIIDILKTFGFSTAEKLLPVPSKLDKETALVPREQLKDIITAILSKEKTPICLHAGAGMGKSSMLRLIEQHLPKECVPIIFDCYGAGSYLDVIDKRHKPDWALMQISNEMAVRTGSPFMLLPPGQPVEVLFREFLDRLRIAGEIVKKINPEAKVVIIVDAADNSITAAEQSSEPSFVTDLVKLARPDGCTIVLTTRTHRLVSLNLPEKHRPIELDPFSLEETKARLTGIFSEATEDQIKQFHQLTKAIPRVQTYALANHEAGLDAILEPLKPGGKTVEDLINSNLNFVSSKLGDKSLVERIFRYLILLPRPVPLGLLSQLADTSEAIITDVVTDTAQGIVLRKDVLVFTDEDFEAYLRQYYSSNGTETEAVATLLLAQADANEYASKHIGNFLLLTGRYEELKDMVFAKKHLIVPKDPVALKEISIDRTRQAMKLSLKEQKTADFLKLQIIAAEAAKTNDTLTETLLSNADLTAMYGDRETVENLYFKSDKLTWYGPVHFRCAAIYARDKETLTEAKSHLKAANSWLDWRDRQPDEELRHYRMSPLDFAFATEAICRLENVETALKWLSKHSYFRIDIVTQLLLRNSLDYDLVLSVNKAISFFNWKLPAKLNIVPVYFAAGEKVPFDTSSLVEEFDGLFKSRSLARFPTKQKVVEAAEYLAINGEKPAQLLKLLSYAKFSPPQSFPHFYASNFMKEKEFVHLDLLFRSKALVAAINDKQLTIEELYPERFTTAESKEFRRTSYEREEKARLDDFFAAALPFYSLRAKFIAGKIDEAVFLQGVKNYCDSFYRNHSIYSYHRELTHFKTYYAGVFSDITVYLKDKEQYISLLKGCFDVKENAIAIRLDIARQISHGKSAHAATLALLKEADGLIFDAQTDASGKISDFLTCVRIGGKLDRSVGQAYFKKMVETVSEIDIEGFDQIRFIADLSTASTGSYPETAYLFTRFVEYAHSRLKNWDHFPWEAGINGSAHLDSAGTLALVCRWDHLRFIQLENFILSASTQAFSRKMIEPEMAASFLYLNTNYGSNCSNYLDQLFDKLTALGSVHIEAIAAELFRLIRYECPHYHQPEMVQELRSRLPSGSSILLEIDEFLAFYAPGSDTEEPTRPAAKERPEITVPDALDLTDVTAVKAFLNSDPGQFRDSEEKLEAIRKKCSVSQYLSFLELILKLDDDDLYYYGRQHLLKRTLTLWQDHPALEDWKKTHFEGFFIKIFPAYLSHDDLLNHPNLTEVAEIFGADEIQLSEVIKRILPAYIDTLSAGHIYQLAKFTKYGMSEAEVVDLINWTLTRWNEKIPTTTLGTAWDNSLVVDASQNISTGLFRYLLSHSHVANRWRVAHALRSLVRWQHSEIIECLLLAQNHKNCTPYQHRDYTYFYISAKLWLWMILSKLAAEAPEAVKKCASYGIVELQNEQLPHMLIRFLAQEYSSILASAFSDVFNADERTLIQNVLVSPFKLGTELPEPELLVKSKEKLQFRFDTTDTVPYWYQPLDALFNVSYQTVPSMSDDVITTDWGYTGNINDDDHIRGDEIDYYATRNDHGDIPSVETLHKYYEFHAMFIVSGKLLKAVPLDHEHGPEAFEDWLRSWMTTFDRLWLADLRDNVPLENLFHESDRPADWSKVIPVDRALQFLKLGSNAPVVKGIFKLHYGKDQESVHIESALVRRQKGESLLKALASAPTHRYKLPEAGEERMEIEVSGFELRGWLTWVSGRDTVYDHFDPFANGISHNYVEPGDILTEQAETMVSDDHRMIFIKNKLAANYLNWNDTTPYPDHSRVETEGQQYRFESKALLSFLAFSGYDLIVECQVSRSREYRRYDQEERQSAELKTLYLIKADGTVSTVEGNFRLGQ
jgi:hypothetical protein